MSEEDDDDIYIKQVYDPTLPFEGSNIKFITKKELLELYPHQIQKVVTHTSSDVINEKDKNQGSVFPEQILSAVRKAFEEHYEMNGGENKVALGHKTITHTSSGLKLEYEKIGKERVMQYDKTEQERGADIAAERMPLPKALQNPNPSGDQIKGYRKLNDTEVQLINSAKEIAIRVGYVCDALDRTSEIDKRWLAIARTQLQQGFMALVRSIAKPETF
jgi:hypothetical protein